MKDEKYDIRTAINHEVFFRSKEQFAKIDSEELKKEIYDSKYFDYIRSICAAHPAETSRHKEFQVCDCGDVSPFILWDVGLRMDNAELYIRIYANDELSEIITRPIFLEEIFAYVKWNYSNLSFLSKQLSNLK